jgi:predicted nucleotidyltransferase
MEQQNRPRGIEMIKHHLLGEDPSSELRVQTVLDHAILEQCHTVALRTLDKSEWQGQADLFTKLGQGSNESFTDFLQKINSNESNIIRSNW